MRRSDDDYLRYMRDSIERVERWSAPGRDAVLADEMRFEAILHRLETLADAVSHLSDALKYRNPDIPWRAIIDFRNRLAHGYLDVKPDRVWDVIVVHLPDLSVVVDLELARSSTDDQPQ